MDLIYTFLIKIEDKSYIVHGWEKTEIPNGLYNSLQEKWIPTIYYNDIQCLK